MSRPTGWIEKYYIFRRTPIANIEIWDMDCKKVEKDITLAKDAISSALNFLACAERISETECDEQLAFDVLRKALEELEK